MPTIFVYEVIHGIQIEARRLILRNFQFSTASVIMCAYCTSNAISILLGLNLFMHFLCVEYYNFRCVVYLLVFAFTSASNFMHSAINFSHQCRLLEFFSITVRIWLFLYYPYPFKRAMEIFHLMMDKWK